MVKKILCQGYLWLLTAIALCAYFHHYDLFLYRSKGAGQLDGILHKTLFIAVHHGYSSLADQCA